VARIITLLTDFGVQSTYPAQMKGVILERCPEAVIVDMSHGVPSHNVHTAAFMLASAAPAFPEGTVHVVVVDPQVGSDRRVLAVEAEGHFYVAPDNGVLTLVARGRSLRGKGKPPAQMVSVENRRFFRTEVSSTFQGRDVFAPVAAAMASGVALKEFGSPVDSIVPFDLPLPEERGDTILGQVLYVDPFGNLVTNVAAEMLAGLRLGEAGAEHGAVQVTMFGAVIRGLCRAYCDVPAGSLLAYIGSAGLLEVAVNRQSAAARLGADIGTPLRVTRSKP